MVVPADYDVPMPVSSQQHFPHYLIVVIVLAVVGILSAVFTAATLIVQRWAHAAKPCCDFQTPMKMAAAYPCRTSSLAH